MSDVRVWKYQGTGNDFVMTFDPEDERPLTADEVRALCDRQFGVGADGSIRVTRGSDGRPFMDYRNADGSVAEMCGNGLRCVAMLLRDLGEETGASFDVETRAGVRGVTFDGEDRVTVDMGEPNFTKAAIPMRGPAWETYLDEPLDLGGGVLVRATAVSMGNPHLVLFLEEDPERFHVSHIGAVLERDERFPEGTNVEFARVGSDAIAARVWERGSGETMACGSGACAIAVAAHETGLVDRRTVIRFPGGELQVEREESGSVRLTGPAERVFETTIDVEALAEARSEALVAIPSESRDEAEILAEIRRHVPGALRVVDEEDSVLLALPERRPGAPLILLAGHVDTVPAAGSAPGRRAGDTIHGRGAADMKGGLAVLLEIAEASAGGGLRSDLDVGLVCFGREELPFGESALMPLFDRRPEVPEAALAIVMEPTDNVLELGCLGNLHATITFEGEAAHTARPWLGRNAIHAAIQALAPIADDLPVRDVEIDGLVYREVASITAIEGGIATNVVPPRATASVNFRYAPDQTPDHAEGRLRNLLAGPSAAVEILGNAPPGPVPAENPLVDRLRGAGDLPVRPKQAWTPVAEFGLIGVDAVNFGPGDPQYAHRDDERVEVAALVRSHDVLRAFLETAP